ncbi:MAG: hypothetical protein AAFZ38_01480 [Myxococcota bacterium]
MKKSEQISAPVAAETKAALDAYGAKTGLKKGRVIEDALLHHLQAIREIPADLIIPPRIVLTSAGMEQIAKSLEGEPLRNAALRDLMRDAD